MTVQLTREKLAEDVYQAVHSVEMEGGRVSPEFMGDARDYVNGLIDIDQWEGKTLARFKAKVS
ncbi:antitoxin VbhA family protein [Bifidobacterium subtile]|jgi:hypothetical protein|uniref:Antitoxin VbhA domain-containing protein n=1 Tax=Bifidobacterium subtile TaxID=77635 RepID=A0A087E207_9BIFI|nr:antitoxin VbhA family protein [Bifidobacterium subtile]KFJ01808.1 hypothetical protein BISU_1822 [Bifidobacterium subtile]MCI1222400.1 antitoxin VbhA family protein [Bifidobacterium subtile]MCI1241211.1 antitoxin VbhA family protein [Bifidobacterium subtile]MCI1258264.1 antitoxin VbhA family protein [Bifidobacterium subtile]QOL37273.1 antitoxin VbhA family protein [Bifidobacterium subtile]